MFRRIKLGGHIVKGELYSIKEEFNLMLCGAELSEVIEEEENVLKYVNKFILYLHDCGGCLEQGM